MSSMVTKECGLVLVGKTGSGKSSLGNSLFLYSTGSEKPFISKKSATSVTKECLRKRATLDDGTLLTIVDTPGLFDTKTPNDDTVKEVVKCLALCAPGPHAIIFVLSLRRFTQEEVATVNILKKLFGIGAMNYFIIVFTGKDELTDGDDDDDDDIQTVADYVEKSPEYLRDFVKECDSRFVGIANRKNSPTHDSDVNDVMQLIYKTMKKNGNQVYSKEAFAKADEVVNKEIVKRKPTSSKTDEEIKEDIFGEIQSNNVGILRTLGRGLTNIVSDTFGYFGI